MPAWGHLKALPKKARVLSFMDPSKDPLGSGYHIIQSKIAVGSGAYRQGLLLKERKALSCSFPSITLDFIFSILSEEWGFAGVLGDAPSLPYANPKGHGRRENAKDRFGFLVPFGIISMLFWHVTINLGMVTGLLPVVGVPLPFFSYGVVFPPDCPYKHGAPRKHKHEEVLALMPIRPNQKRAALSLNGRPCGLRPFAPGTAGTLWGVLLFLRPPRPRPVTMGGLVIVMISFAIASPTKPKTPPKKTPKR